MVWHCCDFFESRLTQGICSGDREFTLMMHIHDGGERRSAAPCFGEDRWALLRTHDVDGGGPQITVAVGEQQQLL